MTQLVVPAKVTTTDAKSNDKDTAPTAVANALMMSEAPAAGKTQDSVQPQEATQSAPHAVADPIITEAPAEPAPEFKSGVVSDL